MVKIVLHTAFVLLLLSVALAQNMPDYTGPWRSSLDGPSSCWTQPRSECNRPLYVMHGGDWDVVKYPYDSFPAFDKAFVNGADAIKGDFRVNADNAGMVMHSSPILAYESPQCYNKKVEDMSTAQCEACPMELSDYTFISAETLLSWAQGKINCMFCVKDTKDIPRAVDSLLQYNATHRAFLEVGVDDYKNSVGQGTGGPQAAAANWEQVWWVVEVSCHADVAALLALPSEARERAFLVEFNNWEDTDDADHWQSVEEQQSDIASCNAAGLRTFAPTNSNAAQATVQNHLDIYSRGFDAVYSYNLQHANDARTQVALQRGLPVSSDGEE